MGFSVGAKDSVGLDVVGLDVVGLDVMGDSVGGDDDVTFTATRVASVVVVVGNVTMVGNVALLKPPSIPSVTSQLSKQLCSLKNKCDPPNSNMYSG